MNPRPFNPANVKKLEKYEYSFLAEHEKSLQSFLTASDPYSAPISERLRAQWIEESKILYGEFTKSGPQKPIHQVGRSKLKDIVESLKKILLSDWNDVNFVIGTNPNDFIEVKFDTANMDTAKGLHAYMNTLMYNNDDLMRFQLRKVTAYWGYQEGGYSFYMIAPPWVNLYINDTINQMTNARHGNERIHKAQAGDSVTEGGNPKRPTLFSKEIAID